jgi:hypothetical protein
MIDEGRGKNIQYRISNVEVMVFSPEKAHEGRNEEYLDIRAS